MSAHQRAKWVQRRTGKPEVVGLCDAWRSKLPCRTARAIPGRAHGLRPWRGALRPHLPTRPGLRAPPIYAPNDAPPMNVLRSRSCCAALASTASRLLSSSSARRSTRALSAPDTPTSAPAIYGTVPSGRQKSDGHSPCRRWLVQRTRRANSRGEPNSRSRPTGRPRPSQGSRSWELRGPPLTRERVPRGASPGRSPLVSPRALNFDHIALPARHGDLPCSGDAYVGRGEGGGSATRKQTCGARCWLPKALKAPWRGGPRRGWLRLGRAGSAGGRGRGEEAATSRHGHARTRARARSQEAPGARRGQGAEDKGGARSAAVHERFHDECHPVKYESAAITARSLLWNVCDSGQKVKF